jgi:galactokinase
VTELFVPGRLCLFGEHSDWAGRYRSAEPSLAPGFCLVVGTDQGLRAEVEARSAAFEIESELPDGTRIGPFRVPATAAALEAAARAGGFFAYAAGTAAELLARGAPGGVALRVRSDLPVKKGLSSSAAICVLVARAFDRCYGLGLGERGEIEAAFAGERRTGSECGRMDPICAYGRRASFLRFDGEGLEVELLAPAVPIQLLIVDLRRGKDTVRILRDLNACFPAAPGPVAAGVRDALGPRNAELLGRARAALLAGDAACLGALMSEAQALFDEKLAPVCPELRAPRLHEVLAHPAARELAYGGKGVGSGGDGSAQLVARGPAERDALAKRLETELGVACLPLGVEPEGSDRPAA